MVQTQLTKRELECLSLWVSGATTKESALILNLSPRTIETYREQIKFKLKIRNKKAIIELIYEKNIFNIVLHYAMLLRENN